MTKLKRLDDMETLCVLWLEKKGWNIDKSIGFAGGVNFALYLLIGYSIGTEGVKEKRGWKDIDNLVKEFNEKNYIPGLPEAVKHVLAEFEKDLDYALEKEADND